MDRLEWHDLPATIRAAVEQHTGPAETAETAPHGVMSRLACTVHTPAGRAFIKGTRHDDPQAWVYRHEARVTRCAPLAPRVLWEVAADGWMLYGYEYIEGRHPDLTPGSGDLAPLLRTLTVTSQAPWPEALDKKPLHTRWTEFLPEDVPPGLQGRRLAHTDMSPHNMLRTPGGKLLLLDWALSCPAPVGRHRPDSAPTHLRRPHSRPGRDDRPASSRVPSGRPCHRHHLRAHRLHRLGKLGTHTPHAAQSRSHRRCPGLGRAPRGVGRHGLPLGSRGVENSMILGDVPVDYRMIAKLADSHKQDCRAATLKPAVSRPAGPTESDVGAGARA